ncbi:MAG: helix-turn-helix domain-containing protein [Nitrosopumilaceae archaeon]
MMISINKNTKEVPRNYNIDVMYRILDALYEMGKSRITDIAVHAGLNNSTTKRYLYIMNEMFDWIKLEQEGKHIVLFLTETGIFVHNQLHDIMPNDGVA